MKVGLLKEAQKNQLVGQLWEPDSYFDPVLDCNDNWIISLEEINGNTNPDFTWVATLPQIDFCKKQYPGPGQ